MPRPANDTEALRARHADLAEVLLHAGINGTASIPSVEAELAALERELKSRGVDVWAKRGR